MAQTLGLQTGRDAGCYNSSSPQLKRNIRLSVEFYNNQVEAFLKTKPTGPAPERNAKAKGFVTDNPKQFHWREEVYRDLSNGKRFRVDDADFVVSTYRPSFKQHLYFSDQLNCRIREFPRVYPDSESDNIGISIVSQGSGNPFHVLMTDNIPDSELTSHTVYYPRYRQLPAQALTQSPDPDNPELERVSNINPAALPQFREHYGNLGISEDDLFYYAYGVLHSRQWREKFADDLTKSAARIPMADTGDDFRAFVAAGRELAELHVNYERIEPCPLLESYGPDWNQDDPDCYRIQKMAYVVPARNPDKSANVCNAHVTLSGIPEHTHEYRLGSRSALDWLIDRYQVKTDSKSGIVNDPNDWATEHGEPRYIVDLVKRVTTVSVRTVEIVRNLPYLRFDDGAE